MIPHYADLIIEIRKVFLKVKFRKPEQTASVDSDLEVAEVCPGYTLVLDHSSTELNIRLASDWTCIDIHTEIILNVLHPNWERFRRWLWDACYEEIRQVLLAISTSMGISFPWPEVVEQDGQKFFRGREESIQNLYKRITIGDFAVHVIGGALASEREQVALRIAIEAAVEVAPGKKVGILCPLHSAITWSRAIAQTNNLDRLAGIQFITPVNAATNLLRVASYMPEVKVWILHSNYSASPIAAESLAVNTYAEVFALTTEELRSRAFRSRENHLCWIKPKGELHCLKHPTLAVGIYQITVNPPPLLFIPPYHVPGFGPMHHVIIPAISGQDLKQSFKTMWDTRHVIHRIAGTPPTLTGCLKGPGKLKLIGQPEEVTIAVEIDVPPDYLRISYSR